MASPSEREAPNRRLGATVRERAPVSSALLIAVKTHKALAGSLLEQLGLYPGQELVLLMLRDAGTLEQRQLVAELSLHPSTVTKMVQRLERSGFVRRTRSVADARAVDVELTPKGRKIIDRVDEVWTEVEAISVEGLTPAQSRTFIALANRIQGSTAAALASR